MQMDRYADASSPKPSYKPAAWAIQAGQYVTLDEYLTCEPVTYPCVPGHQGEPNQRYALVRLHDGTLAIIARNMNCFYARDERTRVVQACRSQEEIRTGMQQFAAMKYDALYRAHDRDEELGR